MMIEKHATYKDSWGTTVELYGTEEGGMQTLSTNPSIVGTYVHMRFDKRIKIKSYPLFSQPAKKRHALLNILRNML